MQNPKTLKHHAALMDRMAAAVGVDLEEAILRGRLDGGEVADAVLACTGCSNPEHCESWLDRQRAPVAATPGYCRNGALFRLLADTRAS